ncbi:MAG: mechanosensitive ion channel family protein [Burkholderiales bacterium]|nr:mechanosensitive ion channel family protein [Burkholderiales bacterium]
MEYLMQQWHALASSGWSGPAVIAVRVVVIGVVAWFVAALLNRMIRVFRTRIASQFTEREQVRRAETIGRVLRYLSSVIVTLIASVLILSELGVSVAPILGAAGVVGLAVGFGAQSLVKDYFTGFFLLLENQLTTGDIVEIAGKSGVVEDVTLRFVRLRDYSGNVHFVPNNLITTVTNMSRSFAQAVIDVGVAYREDTDAAVEVMREVGREMRADPALEKRILADLEIAGVDRWDDSAVILRCRFKVPPAEQWGVRREFLRRLKKAFDAQGIEIPYPHLTIYAGVDRAGNAPPFRLRASNESAAQDGVTAGS